MSGEKRPSRVGLRDISEDEVMAAMRAFDKAEGTSFATHPASYVTTFVEVIRAAEAARDTWTCSRCGKVHLTSADYGDHLLARAVKECQRTAAKESSRPGGSA